MIVTSCECFVFSLHPSSSFASFLSTPFFLFLSVSIHHAVLIHLSAPRLSYLFLLSIFTPISNYFLSFSYITPSISPPIAHSLSFPLSALLYLSVPLSLHLFSFSIFLNSSVASPFSFSMHHPFSHSLLIHLPSLLSYSPTLMYFPSYSSSPLSLHSSTDLYPAYSIIPSLHLLSSLYAWPSLTHSLLYSSSHTLASTWLLSLTCPFPGLSTPSLPYSHPLVSTLTPSVALSLPSTPSLWHSLHLPLRTPIHVLPLLSVTPSHSLLPFLSLLVYSLPLTLIPHSLPSPLPSLSPSQSPNFLLLSPTSISLSCSAPSPLSPNHSPHLPTTTTHFHFTYSFLLSTFPCV